jgi:hypothetical protein
MRCDCHFQHKENKRRKLLNLLFHSSFFIFLNGKTKVLHSFFALSCSLREREKESKLIERDRRPTIIHNKSLNETSKLKSIFQPFFKSENDKVFCCCCCFFQFSPPPQFSLPFFKLLNQNFTIHSQTIKKIGDKGKIEIPKRKLSRFNYRAPTQTHNDNKKLV